MNWVGKKNYSTEGDSVAPNLVQKKKIFLRDLLVVFLIAVSLRTAFSFRSFGDPENRQMEEDSYGYKTLANNFVEGQGFGRMIPVGPQREEVWVPELCRTPGYPLLITGFEWLTGHGRTATIVFQQILGTLLCLMGMVIGQRYFGRKAGLVAGCLLALDLQAIGLSNILLSESVFCFLLFSSVFLVAKCMEGANVWISVGAGLILGISILTKPVGIFLPLVLSVVMTVYAYVKGYRHIIRAAVIIFAVAYLPVCGWVGRNGIVCGEYTLSSVGRDSLLNWYAAIPLARSGDVSLDVARQRLAASAGVPRAQMRHCGLTPEKARKVREVAISAIIESGSASIRVFACSWINLLFGPEKNTLLALGLPHVSLGLQQSDVTELSEVSAASVAILGFQVLILGSVYVMLLVTLWNCISQRRLPSIILICLISTVYILVLSSGPSGSPRYRSAVIPSLVIVAAASLGLKRQSKLDRENESGRRWGTAPPPPDGTARTGQVSRVLSPSLG